MKGGDLTLKQIREMCNRHDGFCRRCPLNEHCVSLFKIVPHYWHSDYIEKEIDDKEIEGQRMRYKGYALVSAEVDAYDEEEAKEKIADKLSDDYFSWFGSNEVVLGNKEELLNQIKTEKGE